MVPRLQCIAYLLPDTLILFPPFSSTRPTLKTNERVLHKTEVSPFFKEYQAAGFCTLPYSLHVCTREEFMPIFKVREARMEDCDDLVPILRKNKILDESKSDSWIASLLESNVDYVQTYIAEVEYY
jgi:hypothetical protein